MEDQKIEMRKYYLIILLLTLIIGCSIYFWSFLDFENTENANNEEMIDEIENFLDSNEGTSSERIDLIYLYESEGDYDQALDLALENVEKDKSYLSYHTLGNIYTTRGEFENARIAREEAASINKSVDSLIYLSNSTLIFDLNEAITLAEQAMSLEMETNTSHTPAKDYLNILKTFEKNFELNPYDATKALIESDYIFFDEIKMQLIQNIVEKNDISNEDVQKLNELKKNYN